MKRSCRGIFIIGVCAHLAPLLLICGLYRLKSAVWRNEVRFAKGCVCCVWTVKTHETGNIPSSALRYVCHGLAYLWTSFQIANCCHLQLTVELNVVQYTVFDRGQLMRKFIFHKLSERSDDGRYYDLHSVIWPWLQTVIAFLKSTASIQCSYFKLKVEQYCFAILVHNVLIGQTDAEALIRQDLVAKKKSMRSRMSIGVNTLDIRTNKNQLLVSVSYSACCSQGS